MAQHNYASLSIFSQSKIREQKKFESSEQMDKGREAGIERW